MRPYHKKVWTCAIIVTFILFCYTFSFAQTENITGVDAKQKVKTPRSAQCSGFYIGIGGNYALENFDIYDVKDDFAPFELHADFDRYPTFQV